MTVMDTPYNLTAVGNIEGFGDILGFADSILGNHLYVMIIFALFMIILISLILRRTPIEQALMVTSYACLLPALIMAWAGLLDIWIVLLLIILAALGMWASNHITRY